MVDIAQKIQGNIRPVTPHGQPVPSSTGKTESAFQKILGKQLERQEDLKFSIHAQERIRARGIPLSNQEVERLKTGVNQVADKGGRESVVLMDDTAFLISVKNRTVITAIGQDQLKNNVFTNIDSAVIV